MSLFGLVLAVGTAGASLGVDLAGSEWRPSFMSAAELPAGIKMQVEFQSDGRITGSGGCNRFFGGYTISGNHIKIGPLASTRKGCPGPDQSGGHFLRHASGRFELRADRHHADPVRCLGRQARPVRPRRAPVTVANLAAPMPG